MKPIISAIASFGLSGQKFHAPFLHCNPKFRLKTIVERSKDEASKHYPDVKVVRSFDEIVGDPEIELIVVNTPDITHYQYARQALLAGKHLVVEKPFVLDSSDGQKLIDLAKQQNRILSVYHNRRYDNGFLTMLDIQKKNTIGRIVECEMRFSRFRNFINNKWKELPEHKTGLTYDLGSHLIDQALVMFGMPDALWADIDYLRDGSKMDDYMLIRFYYDKLKVTLKASYLECDSPALYTLYGIEGSYIKHSMDPQSEMLNQGILPTDAAYGIEKDENSGILRTNDNGTITTSRLESKRASYMDYYENIYEAIRNNAPLAVKADEGLQVVKLIEAAYKSSREKIVVKIVNG